MLHCWEPTGPAASAVMRASSMALPKEAGPTKRRAAEIETAGPEPCCKRSRHEDESASSPPVCTAYCLADCCLQILDPDGPLRKVASQNRFGPRQGGCGVPTLLGPPGAAGDPTAQGPTGGRLGKKRMSSWLRRKLRKGLSSAPGTDGGCSGSRSSQTQHSHSEESGTRQLPTERRAAKQV
jgi:hypothetical protein